MISETTGVNTSITSICHNRNHQSYQLVIRGISVGYLVMYVLSLFNKWDWRSELWVGYQGWSDMTDRYDRCIDRGGFWYEWLMWLMYWLWWFPIWHIDVIDVLTLVASDITDWYDQCIDSGAFWYNKLMWLMYLRWWFLIWLIDVIDVLTPVVSDITYWSDWCIDPVPERHKETL